MKAHDEDNNKEITTIVIMKIMTIILMIMIVTIINNHDSYSKSKKISFNTALPSIYG